VVGGKGRGRGLGEAWWMSLEGSMTCLSARRLGRFDSDADVAVH